jgi:hypothetical protein
MKFIEKCLDIQSLNHKNTARLHYRNSQQTTFREIIAVYFKNLKTLNDRLCGLVVRVPGCRTEMYCVSCEVRTEFIYVEESRPPLWSSGQSSWLQIQILWRYQIF